MSKQNQVNYRPNPERDRCRAFRAWLIPCVVFVVLFISTTPTRGAPHVHPTPDRSGASTSTESSNVLDKNHSHATAQVPLRGMSEVGVPFIDFFTGGGSYMPRTHCLVRPDGSADWPWIITLIVLSAGVILAYVRIFIFWMRSYFGEHKRDRNSKLFELAIVFLLCAICGYAMSILMFIWPGYRLLAVMLALLNIVVWKFCANLRPFQNTFFANRLTRQLRESTDSREQELEKLVQIRTLEVNRLAEIARRTGNAVIITNANGLIEWVNEGFTRITGYELDDVLGRTPGQVLQGPDTDPAQVQRLREAVRTGSPVKVELVNYGKSGHKYMIEIELIPLRDDTGALTGFMSIESDTTEKHAHARRITESETRFRMLADSAPMLIWTCDADGRCDYFNRPWLDFTGLQLSGAVGYQWESIVHPDDLATYRHLLNEALREHKPFSFDIRLRRHDGEYRTVGRKGVPRFSDDGTFIGFVGAGTDITELHEARDRADAALRESEALRHTLDAHAIFSVADARGKIIDINDAFCQISGYSRDELIGQDHHVFNSGFHPRNFWVEMWRTITSGNAWHGEICNRAKDGSLYWVDSIIAPFKGADGRIEKIVSIRTDITARKLMEQELRSAARTDRLTGLPNRALVCDRIQQAVLRARRVKGYHFAVLFLDFDRFKLVNDSLGHEAGDKLLKQIAERLLSAVRAGDTPAHTDAGNTSGRLGGDEFVVLLDGLASPEHATHVADRLLGVFSQPYDINGHEIYSSASIGVVTSTHSSSSADEVLRDADTAMYEAKLAGKGQYVVFDVSMRKRLQNRVNLESELRKAIDLEQLFLMYQPIVSLQTGQVESFEVLVRWRHPERGLISPGEFIPLAEDTGLIVRIGEWVLRNACAQLARWRATAGAATPRNISVNLSRNQLFQPGLPDLIDNILKSSGLTPDCLHLEVTESAVMRDVTVATEMLHAIKKLGVRLSMDDFGTGYSSLACLHTFPLDVLKIDRSFINNLSRGRDFAALVHAVAQLARNLNIQVVAEGIETTEQAVMLQALDVEFGQGYLFSKPLPPEQVLAFRVNPQVMPGLVQIAS